jgi:transcription antitermination factor NusG
VQTAFEIDWREVEVRPPDRGVFVELARATLSDKDRFGLNASEKKPFAKVYWNPHDYRSDGLYWRPVPADNFVSREPITERPPIDEDDWYIVLVEPNQELTTVWRLHEEGKELYIPSIRKRVKTGRTGKNGTKVTRVIPKPMFPGYGLLRKTAKQDPGTDIKTNISIEGLKATRGFREVLRDEKGDPVTLPHEAVLAIFRKESQERHEFVALHAKGKKRASFKSGDTVRVEAPGNVYDGLLATIEKDDGKDRIKVFLGMAKIAHTLPADMVVAA